MWERLRATTCQVGKACAIQKGRAGNKCTKCAVACKERAKELACKEQRAATPGRRRACARRATLLVSTCGVVSPPSRRRITARDPRHVASFEGEKRNRVRSEERRVGKECRSRWS